MLSGGRLELGVGAGWLIEEAEALGLPHDHRAERLTETLEIAQLAWTRNSFTFAGRFWNFAEVGVHPHPPQGRSLPVWIGGTSSSALRTTADYAIGSIVALFTSEQVHEMRGRLDAVKGGLRLASLIEMTPSVKELSDLASAHLEAGADLVILQTTGSKEEIRRVIAEFASRNLRRP
jgi:alkanesulfonate monooxygenase SsuD/methylene tetrahydromethanopterin reductase-like flavin-dependent oxidoreductase (luciferase family)